MKMEFKNRQPITIIVASISTLAFASLSIYNVNSWMLRILTQGSLCLTMLLNGIKYFIYQRQKVLGSLLWIVSGFLLFVMIYTIQVSLLKNTF